MASTYTTDLRLNKQGIGDNNNTWGAILNTQLDLLDDSISGMVTVNVTTGVDVTLSTANGTTDEARKMILKLSGTPIADISVITPAINKIYIVNANGLAGNFTVTIKPTAGTGVAFSAGECGIVAFDGTNMVEICRKADSAPTGDVKIFSGTIASALINYPGYGFMDGTNGTPDLRDKFVVQARQDDAGAAKTNITGSLTQTGGSTTTSSNGGQTVTSEAVALTVAQLPPHTHSAVVQQTSGGNLLSYFQGSTTILGTGTTGSTGSGDTHDHDVTIANHTHTTVQPYYALVFLMKL